MRLIRHILIYLLIFTYSHPENTKNILFISLFQPLPIYPMQPSFISTRITSATFRFQNPLDAFKGEENQLPLTITPPHRSNTPLQRPQQPSDGGDRAPNQLEDELRRDRRSDRARSDARYQSVAPEATRLISRRSTKKTRNRLPEI